MPPPSSSSCSSWRETLPIVRTSGAIDDDDEEEEEKATLARFVPLNSEVREILDDPEQTLAYMRKVQASIPDPDSALDSLVKVYEDRVERLAKERALAADLASMKALAERETARAPTSAARAPKKRARAVDGAMRRLEPHFWKIVYGVICCWGLVQLALIR